MAMNNIFDSIFFIKIKTYFAILNSELKGLHIRRFWYVSM